MRIYNRSSKLLVYTTDGNKSELADLSKLDYDFEIESQLPYKKDGKNHTVPTTAVINVYKLSVATRNKLSAESSGVEVQAGYDDDTTPIFNGVITNVVHTYDAPDWVTTIWASDGWAEYSTSYFSQSYAAETPVATIINDAASSFAIPVVDRSENTDKLLTGTVYDGKSRDVMDRLAGDYNLAWSIDSGAVTIIDALNPPLVDRSRAVVLSSDLLNGPTIEESLEQTKNRNKRVVRRARAIALLNPALFPGVPVQFKVTSVDRSFSEVKKQKLKDVNPEAYYVCDSVTHRGSNWSPENLTEIITREETAE